MASLLDLPEEILIMIIKQLDLKSMYNLYMTSGVFKNIIIMKGVIKTCNLSRNSLSTPKTLQSDMIKSISGHLYELNMSGVFNLKKGVLLPALSKMKCLKILDVSYTEIEMFDMLELYTFCPTIKDLTINFPYQPINLTDKALEDCQSVFRNFDNVHFIIRVRFPILLQQIFKNVTLDMIKFTFCDDRGGIFQWDESNAPCPFRHFCAIMFNFGAVHTHQGSWKEYFPMINMENIEYILLEYNVTFSVSASAMFKEFFAQNFKITKLTRLDVYKKRFGAVAVFLWDKRTTVFDQTFFCNLRKKLKDLLIYEVPSERPIPLGIHSHSYKWFLIQPPEFVADNKKTPRPEPDFKKRRTVHNDHVLDYDVIFTEQKKIKLKLNFVHSVCATLSSQSEYLKKLTYLSLSGIFVRYSNEFFNVLFRCCTQLITLNVEASVLTPCHASVMRCIPLSQSIKNFRIVDKRIDFQTFFLTFTQCKTLENVCVVDKANEFSELADLIILYQCDNLYCAYLQAEMKKTTAIRLNTINKGLVKIHPEHYIHIVIDNGGPINPIHYNPYLDVFNLKSIKPA